MRSIGLAKVTEIVDPDRFIIKLTIAGVIEEVLAYPLTNDDVPAVDEEVLALSVESLLGFSYFYNKLRLLDYTKFEYEDNLIILNNDGISVTAAEENTLTVTSDGDITTTSAGNITIHADGDITIDAGGSISITSSSDMSISSGGSVSVEASTNIDVSAGANLDMSAGSEATLEGTATTLSGSSTLEVSGGTVTVPNGVPSGSVGPFIPITFSGGCFYMLTPVTSGGGGPSVIMHTGINSY